MPPTSPDEVQLAIAIGAVIIILFVLGAIASLWTFVRGVIIRRRRNHR